MSQLNVSVSTAHIARRAARPMMSREADAMYWMSRYVERSEHIARLLTVNANLLMDVGDLAPSLQRQQWHSVLDAVRTLTGPIAGHKSADGPLGDRVMRYMSFDGDNPNSLICCLTRARENARAIRESISAEMWENLNALYWSITGEDARARFDDAAIDFYRDIMVGSMLFQGLSDQTLAHDQRWQFAQLGKYIERIDVTARVIESKFEFFQLHPTQLDGALRNMQWMSVLRSCCSIEAYRRNHLGDMDPLRVATFLILEPNFPRSIRFAVEKLHEAISAIRREVNPAAVDPAERILGRLHAQLEYAEVDEIAAEGFPQYMRKIQTDISDAAMAVQKTYFLH